MPETVFERAPDGAIIGLQHHGDPLEGRTKGTSALDVAQAYVAEVAGLYRITPDFLDRLGESVSGKYDREEGSKLRLEEAKAVQSFLIFTFRQTLHGIPVWERGLTLRMAGPDNVVTGSSSSVAADIELGNPPTPPASRDKQAGTVLREAVKGAKFTKFKVNDIQDFVYRYDAKHRLPHKEPGEIEGAELTPLPDIGRVPKGLKDGEWRFASLVHFGCKIPDYGELNWRALVDWETNAVLYIRPLVGCVSGYVFTDDPISLSGDSELDPTAPVALLDAQRELVALERLILPGGGAPVELSGELVAVRDLDTPNIAPPTENAGAASVFDYPADSDNFAAVCAYYNHDFLYRFVQSLGFDLPSYFDGVTFPVDVDHRWFNPAAGPVNAQAPGNAIGDGVLRFRYALAANGSTVGMATDSRVSAHEFGHAVLWDHLNWPNFGFCHGFGDALAAILYDPQGIAPDRFRTFPFSNLITRRWDRSVASGWGWGGTMDVGGYLSTEINATTLGRIYLSLGGDSTDLNDRLHASRYTIYLILQAVPLLAGIVPNTVEGFSRALQESDQNTALFDGAAGGWAHKVVRWGFEKQALYNGAPPDVDVFIDDGRQGEYPWQQSGNVAPGIWNRHRPDGGTDHETPRRCVENYLYVRIGNRGNYPAQSVTLSMARATEGKGATWPDDWDPLIVGEPIGQSVHCGDEVIVGPIPWCPEDLCEEYILASADTPDDRSNVETIAGSLPVDRLALGDNNVALRRMEVNLSEDDTSCCDEEEPKMTYRYAVKVVCGCSKGRILSPGRYHTAINIGNGSGEPVRFRKRVSSALPNEKPGNVSARTKNKLGPWESMEIDCEDVVRHLRVAECCFLKGFLFIDSETPLDVVAVYTAAHGEGEVETIDVEPVVPRLIRKTPPPPPPPPPPDTEEKPDLIPVQPFPPGPPSFPAWYCEEPRKLRIIVRNIGAGAAGPSTTRVDFFQSGVVVDLPTPALGPNGDETTLSLVFPDDVKGGEQIPFKITVNANPVDGVVETDTTNNSDSSSCGLAS